MGRPPPCRYVRVQSSATVREGSVTPVLVAVERVRGTYGNASVTLSTTNGTNLTVLPSVVQWGDAGTDLVQHVNVTSPNDSIPEPEITEVLSLTSPVGVRLETGVSTTAVLVTDDDNLHGLFGFAPEPSVAFVSNATHRGVVFTMVRLGGTRGNASVGVNVTYHLSDGTVCPGGGEACPVGTRLLPPVPSNIVFGDGVGEVVTFVAADNSSQFAVGSYFNVLIGNLIMLTPESPSDPAAWIAGRLRTQRATVVRDR